MTKIEINLNGDQGNRTFITAMVKAHLDSIGKTSKYEVYLDKSGREEFDHFIKVSMEWCPIMIIRRV